MRKPLVLVALVLAVVALAFGGPGEAQRGPLKIGFVTSETGILAANGKDRRASPRRAASSRGRGSMS